MDGQHWLTTRQLLDGLALGQLTPGPVTTVATFAGYTVAGFPGGVVATIAVFAPSFILVLSLTPLLLRVRNAPIAKAFLKGITAGALGAIAAAAILFGRAAIIDPITAADRAGQPGFAAALERQHGLSDRRRGGDWFGRALLHI